MRGSVVYQVHQVFSTIIAFGQSKHEAKEQARQEGSKTWHDLGKNIAIYSFATADQYRDISKNLLNYVKENYSIKDIEKLTSEHIQSYLETKIADGVKYSTFQKYASALEKLEVALNQYAESHNTNNKYEFNIKEVREQAQEVLEKSQTTRAYENPKELIKSIQNPEYKVIAQAQLEGGFRVSELNHMSEKNFLPDNTFRVISGKGGKDREVPLPSNVYNALKYLVENKADVVDGKYKFNMDKYRYVIQEAAIRSNQEYTGSHGLRWNFAQETFMRLQEQGRTYEQALQEVSNLLGHERADITRHYLR